MRCDAMGLLYDAYCVPLKKLLACKHSNVHEKPIPVSSSQKAIPKNASVHELIETWKASTVRITHTDLTEKRMMSLPGSHTTAKPLENKITSVRSEDQRKQEARHVFSSFFLFSFF